MFCWCFSTGVDFNRRRRTYAPPHFSYANLKLNHLEEPPVLLCPESPVANILATVSISFNISMLLKRPCVGIKRFRSAHVSPAHRVSVPKKKKNWDVTVFTDGFSRYVTFFLRGAFINTPNAFANFWTAASAGGVCWKFPEVSDELIGHVSPYRTKYKSFSLFLVH